MSDATKMAEYITSKQGGKVFQTSPMTQFDRFLICGSAAGTYYATGKQHTIENVKNLISLIQSPDTGIPAIKRIVEVSDRGKAPKNDPALMALAVASCSPSEEVRRAAFHALGSRRVARIGTHLQHFFAFRKALTGGKWKASRMARRAVSDWYNNIDPERMAYDVTKYQQRDGVSHADILKLMHPPLLGERSDIARYVLNGTFRRESGNRWTEYVSSISSIANYESLRAANPEYVLGSSHEDHVCEMIREYNLPREVIPTKFLTSRRVWEALFPKMPIHALVRNLNKMTAIGLFKDEAYVDHVVQMLAGSESPFLLKKQRMHPMTLLVAARQYATGKGEKGSLAWSPVKEIVAALDHAFYVAFGAVEPTNARICLCLDISGSMAEQTTVGLSSREIAAASALVTLATEPNARVVGFGSKLYHELPISKDMDLLQVLNVLPQLPQNTYGKLPVEYAIEMKQEYDAFVYYTDGQFSDAGGVMSFDTTLNTYRKLYGDTKCVVVAATANNLSLFRPDDALSIDVAGFDTSVPHVINSFLTI